MNFFGSDIPVRRLFGIGVHAVTMERALALCRRAIETRAHLNIGVVNAAKIVAMRNDPVLSGSSTGRDGLANMRHRLQQIGGECKILSAIGKGTRVEFLVPVNPATT